MLFKYCMEKFSREDLDFMAVIARRIGLRRNALVFDGVFAHSDVVFAKVAGSLDEFKKV
jgi:hypothetical protein